MFSLNLLEGMFKILFIVVKKQHYSKKISTHTAMINDSHKNVSFLIIDIFYYNVSITDSQKCLLSLVKTSGGFTVLLRLLLNKLN